MTMSFGKRIGKEIGKQSRVRNVKSPEEDATNHVILIYYEGHKSDT